MGYRSEVRISSTKEAFEALREKVEETCREQGGCASLLDAGSLDYCQERNGFVVYGWDEIKWYASYPEVAAVEAALEKVAEKGIAFKFFRFGEDEEDVSLKTYGEAKAHCMRIATCTFCEECVCDDGDVTE